MTLVRSLMEGTYGIGNPVDTSKYDGMFKVVDESVMAAQEIALMEGIYATSQAVMTADIIGSVKVVTEGANATAVMENIVTSAIGKLKEYWNKFLAATKKFFGHVIDTVKAMFKDGGDFAKTYGQKIKDKINVVKEFKVKVWDYSKFSDGDSFIDKVTSAVVDKCKKANDSLLSENPSFSSDLGGTDPENLKSESDFMEDFIGGIESGCTSSSDLKDEVMKKYHNNAGEKDDTTWKEKDVTDALKVLTDYNSVTTDIQKKWNAHEKTINDIIKKLNKLGNKKDAVADDTIMSGSDESKKTAETNRVKGINDIHKAASHASKLEGSLLTLGRQMVSVKTEIYKERYKSYTAILKSFFAFKREKAATTEGMVFEGDESLDFDLKDGEVLENAVDSADTPEGDQGDISISLEGFSGSSLMREAMSLLD